MNSNALRWLGEWLVSQRGKKVQLVRRACMPTIHFEFKAKSLISLCESAQRRGSHDLLCFHITTLRPRDAFMHRWFMSSLVWTIVCSICRANCCQRISEKTCSLIRNGIHFANEPKGCIYEGHLLSPRCREALVGMWWAVNQNQWGLLFGWRYQPSVKPE